FAHSLLLLFISSSLSLSLYLSFLFFFNDTATTDIYTLSLHDALPIYPFFIPRGLQHVVRFVEVHYRGMSLVPQTHGGLHIVNVGHGALLMWATKPRLRKLCTHAAGIQRTTVARRRRTENCNIVGRTSYTTAYRLHARGRIYGILPMAILP